jgi:hypothetical protein
MSTPAAPTVTETLAWEAENRTRTGLASIIAGNLVLIGGVALGLVLRDAPRVGVLDGIRAAAHQTLANGSTGLLTPQVQFYNDKAVGLVLSYAAQGIGAALVAVTLGYLFRATKARRPALPRVALYGAVVGPVVIGVSLLVLGVGLAVEAHDFVSKGDLSTKAAHDALSGGIVLAVQALHAAAGIAVAFAFFLVSINAMRVGLLTRFMGVLGCIVGALFIVPLGSAFVVQGFWLIAFGFILLGRWPNGRPPAWETGKAEPWPTQQELREQRGDAPRGSKTEALAPSDAAADEPTTTPHSSSRKRKRKRR